MHFSGLKSGQKSGNLLLDSITYEKAWTLAEDGFSEEYIQGIAHFTCSCGAKQDILEQAWKGKRHHRDCGCGAGAGASAKRPSNLDHKVAVTCTIRMSTLIACQEYAQQQGISFSAAVDSVLAIGVAAL